MRLLFIGSKTRTEVFDLVNEYITREKLAKIGFMASDLKELDSEKALHMLLVNDAIERELAAQAKRKHK